MGLRLAVCIKINAIKIFNGSLTHGLNSVGFRSPYGERIRAQKGMGYWLMPFFVPSLAQRAELVDEMLQVACKRTSRGKRSRLLDAHSLAIARRLFEIVPACIVRRHSPWDERKAR